MRTEHDTRTHNKTKILVSNSTKLNKSIQVISKRVCVEAIHTPARILSSFNNI